MSQVIPRYLPVACTFSLISFALGGARIWKPIELPRSLQRDSGVQFVDQNTARIPKYPFEVAFRATELMRPGFRFDDVDVVVNRNSLRKLLDFCHGRAKDSFRIDLYMVHNTLIIERREKSVKELI